MLIHNLINNGINHHHALPHLLSLIWLHLCDDTTDVVHCKSGVCGKRVDNITTRQETKSQKLKAVCRVHVKLDSVN